MVIKVVTDLKSFLQEQPAVALLDDSSLATKKDESSSTQSSSSFAATATLIVDSHCVLGECIIYDDVQNALYWTDILGRRFHKLSLDVASTPSSSAEVETFELPKMLGAFALIDHNNATNAMINPATTFLFGWEDGFQLYDPVSGKEISPMSKGEDVNPVKHPTRLNDGRCDPQGEHFICGGFNGEDGKGNTMKVYKCHVDKETDAKIAVALAHEPIVDKIQVTNSICFSNDGKTMYLGDSPTTQIYSYQYNNNNNNTENESGSTSSSSFLSNKTLFHQTPYGVPDGSCVDEEGYVWNAVWRGHDDGEPPGVVHRLDPNTGKIVFTVNMPDTTSRVSCCCFGGKQFDILFITTAAVDSNGEKEPHAGGIYAIKLGFVKGRPEARFKV